MSTAFEQLMRQEDVHIIAVLEQDLPIWWRRKQKQMARAKRQRRQRGGQRKS